MNKNTWKIVTAQCLSRFGDNIEYIALCLLCYRMTGSVVPIGIVSVVSAVPNILFTLVGGAFSEYSDKKRTMLVCEFFRAGCILSLLLLREMNRVEIVYIVTFLVSTAESFFEPCCSSYVSCSIDEKEYPKFCGISNTAFQIVSILGLAVGGFLVGTIGEYRALVLDAATFVFSALVVVTLPVYQTPRRGEKSNIAADILDGLRCLFQIRDIRLYLFMLVLMAVIVSPIEPYVTAFVNSSDFPFDGDIALGIMFAILSTGVIAGNFLILTCQKRTAFQKFGLYFLTLTAIVGVACMAAGRWALLAIGILLVGVVSGGLRTVSVPAIITGVAENYRARASAVIVMTALCVSPAVTMAASYFIERRSMGVFFGAEIGMLALLFVGIAGRGRRGGKIHKS